MKKKEFLNLLSRQAGISYEEASLFYDKFIQRFTKALKSGQSVKFSKFGEFKLKLRKARKTFDPKTGLEKTIPAKNLVAFHPWKSLLDKINAKYRDLRPIPVRTDSEVDEDKELSKFNFAPAALEEKQDELERKEEVMLEKESESPKDEIIDASRSAEVYETESVKSEFISTADVLSEKKDEIEEKTEKETKNNNEVIAMPEFNLSEKSQPNEKKEPKKIYDDTKRENIPIPFEYESEDRKRVGFWIFLFIAFAVLIIGFLVILNRYGYIRLWDGKKTEQVQLKKEEPPTKAVVDTVKPEEKIPTIKKEEKEKPKMVVKRKVSRARNNYVVQVASFRNRNLANALASELRRKGYKNVFIQRAYISQKGGNWYRVRIGYFDSIRQASKIANRLEREPNIEETWISRIKVR